MSPDLAGILLQVVLGGGLLGAGWAYWRERRKNRAEGIQAEALAEVAHETVLSEVARVGISALEAQIVAMQRAWDLERSSTDRRLTAADKRIEYLEIDNTRLRDDRAIQDRLIRELREEIERMQVNLDALRQRIDDSIAHEGTG